MNLPTLQLGLLVAMLGFSYLVMKLVRYIKTKRVNTELWCTVFEGLTQRAVRLDDLKAPEEVIEKKSRRDGQNKKDDPADEIAEQVNQRLGGD